MCCCWELYDDILVYDVLLYLAGIDLWHLGANGACLHQVVSARMTKSITVAVDYYRQLPKYDKRLKKMTTKLMVRNTRVKCNAQWMQ